MGFYIKDIEKYELAWYNKVYEKTRLKLLKKNSFNIYLLIEIGFSV